MSIPEYGFNPPDTGGAGFEITDLATLRGRMTLPDAVHRTDFHTINLVTDGHGDRAADFTTYPCRPGTLLWIRPGQVQRYDWSGTMNGPHVLFTSAFPARFSGADHLVADWSGPVCWQLGAGPDYALVATLLDQLRAEFTRADGPISTEILQFLLAALLLQIDRLPRPDQDGDPHAGGEPYARFRAELARSYRTTRRAEDYAQRLGYTVRTLTRACLAATGQPVKHVIDERVALEARRLLAHTDEPVAVIARRLGFSEPTNFGKFFTRHTGMTPGEFRHSVTAVDRWPARRSPVRC
ncbi:MAG TPA: AraC family transcriptional regulator [Kutzneria sp.]|nr:AraC family transcriptional regulator [Kutzneria sp.]